MKIRQPKGDFHGMRQSGKTTLAREIVPVDSINYFDLENPASLARLEQPLIALEDLRGTVVIDEIQHRSDLFPILRVLADRKPLPARFLTLGSASPELLRQSSESLAGRLETIPVTGLGLAEVGTKALNRAELDLLLFKGGRRFGVEIKRMDAPTLTPSMRIALADLQLEHLTVVLPRQAIL
jgi:predicted AAA+ superfamily ATPase